MYHWYTNESTPKSDFVTTSSSISLTLTLSWSWYLSCFSQNYHRDLDFMPEGDNDVELDDDDELLVRGLLEALFLL